MSDETDDGRAPQVVVAHMQEHSRAFLLSLRADGSPTAHPMTALISEGRVRFNTYRKSAKARNVERDARMGAVLLNGYGRQGPDVAGFGLEGQGSLVRVEVPTERLGEGAKISASVKERVGKRVAEGKRVMVELATEQCRPLDAVPREDGGATEGTMDREP